MTEKDDNDEPQLVRGEVVYIGPKFLADLKLRFGEWLEKRRRR